jgi:hypothetical protein
MRKTVLTLVPLAIALTACGNDSGAPTTAPAETAPPAAPVTEAAPTPQVAIESTAAPITDEVVYDPIDVSTLQSSWWQQYSKGG